MSDTPGRVARVDGLIVTSLYDLVEAPNEEVSLAESARALVSELIALNDAGLGMLIVDDGYDADDTGLRLDAVIALSFVSQHVPGMGLVAGTPVAYLEPFHVAKRIQTLDYATHGFAGWLVSDEATETGYARVDATAAQRPDASAFAAEFVDVVVELWDSWEDGAIVRNREQGVYLDPARVHHIDHDGTYHTVRGPSLTPRSPQGRPPILRRHRAGDPLSGHGADLLLVDAEGETSGTEQPSLRVVSPGDLTGAYGPLLVDGSHGAYRAARETIIGAITPRADSRNLRGRLGLAPADNQYASVGAHA